MEPSNFMGDFTVLPGLTDGKWQVASNETHWYIINVSNGRKKRIGVIGGKRRNFFTKAWDLAEERNQRDKLKS